MAKMFTSIDYHTLQQKKEVNVPFHMHTFHIFLYLFRQYTCEYLLFHIRWFTRKFSSFCSPWRSFDNIFGFLAVLVGPKWIVYVARGDTVCTRSSFFYYLYVWLWTGKWHCNFLLRWIRDELSHEHILYVHLHVWYFRVRAFVWHLYIWRIRLSLCTFFCD